MVTAFFCIMPAIPFSGFGFPISTMPQWLQYCTYLSPLRYFLVVLRSSCLKAVGMDVLWPQMLAMGALGVALLTMSVLRFHKALDEIALTSLHVTRGNSCAAWTQSRVRLFFAGGTGGDARLSAGILDSIVRKLRANCHR